MNNFDPYNGYYYKYTGASYDWICVPGSHLSHSLFVPLPGEPKESQGGDHQHGGGDVSCTTTDPYSERGAGEEEQCGQRQVFKHHCCHSVTFCSLERPLAHS